MQNDDDNDDDNNDNDADNHKTLFMLFKTLFIYSKGSNIFLLTMLSYLLHFEV
jgi:hypothetical protein